MLLKYIPDANTEGGSSTSSQKTEGDNKQASSPLAEAMSIATATPGGEGEATPDETKEGKEADGEVLKKNGTESENDTKGEQAKGSPEGDEEQDEKVQEDETEKSDDEKEEGAEEDTTKEGETSEAELTPEQKAENERLDKHPRFQELIAKKNEYEPLAKTQRELQEYCSTHGITGEQFQQALSMAALMNVDPVKARAALKPIMDSLDAYVGEKLPEDLQKRVDNATLDINDAKEIAQLRAQTKMGATRTQQTQEQLFNNACVKAVTDWETSKRKSDPDYDKKAELIEDAFVSKLQTARATGKEPTPADRVRFAEEAWKKVTDKIIVFLPKRPTRQSFKTNGSRTTGTAEAKTPQELAAQIAAKHK